MTWKLKDHFIGRSELPEMQQIGTYGVMGKPGRPMRLHEGQHGWQPEGYRRHRSMGPPKYVQGTEVNTLPALAHSILTTTLRGRNHYYYSHFTD